MDMYGDIVPRFLYFVPSPKAKLGGLQGQWRDALEDLLLDNFMIRVLWEAHENGQSCLMNECSLFKHDCVICSFWPRSKALCGGRYRRAHHTGERWSNSFHCSRGAQCEGAMPRIFRGSHKCISIDEWSMRASTSMNSTNFIQLLQPIYLTKV